MNFTKRAWIRILVATFLVVLVGFSYKVLTFRHHPPSKSTQRNALSMLQSQDNDQIYEGLRLLSIFQPADELRSATERHLSHEDPRIRMQAIFMIHRYRDVQAGVSLTKLLDDPDPKVAEEAQRGLHNVNNSLGLPFDKQHFGP
jgi:hypothetical protein